MRTLIIGGNSSLGRALRPIFSSFSEVFTAGRQNSDFNFDLAGSTENSSFPFSVDVVIHTAAHFGGNTIEEMIDAENVNVLGTLKACQAAIKVQAKHFILISTIFASLDATSNHYTIYALSKKQSEEVARFVCASHSLPLTILRPSQLYGNEDRFRRHQPFFYSIVDKAEKGEDIFIYGTNDALRNFIHVEDLAVIVAKVAQKRIEGTYVCTHPSNVSYSRIATSALSAFNSKGNVHFLREEKDIPDNVFELDDSLYRKIDFYPRISIEDGMKKIKNYRSQL